MSNFQGVYSVLATPFLSDGSIDRDGLKKLIELFIQAGVSGFTALGVTSESSRLSEKGKREVIDLVFREVGSRIPVIVGTTAEGTQNCIESSRAAVAAGASGVMVSPPRMPKLNSEAVLRHYKSLAEAVDTSIVVQDYPPVSGYAMEASLLTRIVKEIPKVKAIKLEDAPTPFKIARIRESKETSTVAIFGGLGGVYLLEELLAGATGAMTGFAFPEILIQVVENYHSAEIEKAKDIFYRYVPLMRFEFQEGIGMAIRKEMLRRRGVFTTAYVSAPGAQLDSSTSRSLDELLNWYKTTGFPWL
jgi:4-hydroxy-tetrahydrodipicolinate synthase